MLKGQKGHKRACGLCSLTWAFHIREHILQYTISLLVDNKGPNQGPFVQSIVSLTSSLMLLVLRFFVVFSDTLIFLLQKM